MIALSRRFLVSIIVFGRWVVNSFFLKNIYLQKLSTCATIYLPLFLASVCVPVSSTSSRILDYLRQRGPATAEDLARVLGLSAADVRHHLAKLMALSLVEVIGRRPADGRGRPRKVYGLSACGLGDNLDTLAGALLITWLGEADDRQRGARMRALAQYLAWGEGGAPQPQSAWSLRLKRAIERLNELHYRARWEASAQGPRVILERCPYRNLAENRPELCDIDASLLTALTGGEVVKVARRERNPQGFPVCVFLLREDFSNEFNATA